MSEAGFGTVAQGEPEVRARSAEPRPIWLSPLLPIGIAAILVGTMVLNDVTAEIRVTLVLVGIVGGVFRPRRSVPETLGVEVRHLGMAVGILADAGWPLSHHRGLAAAS